MSNYIVYSRQLKPSKVKGELPDVFYAYIANDSHIGYHYIITSVREEAYIFDESELEHVQLIADSWSMKVKNLE